MSPRLKTTYIHIYVRYIFLIKIYSKKSVLKNRKKKNGKEKRKKLRNKIEKRENLEDRGLATIEVG